MKDLYERLDSTEEREDRRKIISAYLSSQNLTNMEGCQLSEKTSTPSNENLPCFSLPLVVGNKYIMKRYLYDSGSYLLGILDSPDEMNLLMVTQFWGEDMLRRIPINWIVSPEKDGITN